MSLTFPSMSIAAGHYKEMLSYLHREGAQEK